MNARRFTMIALGILAVMVISGVWNAIAGRPRVSLTLTGFSATRNSGEEGLYAVLQLTNGSNKSITYDGYAVDSPLTWKRQQTPVGKESEEMLGCGFGLQQFTVAPGSAVTLKADVETNELCKIALVYYDGRKPSPIWRLLPARFTRRLPWARDGETVETDAINTHGMQQVSILHKEAEAGIAEAQFKLAGRYWTGNGVEKNLTEAIRWFETAATNGQQEAAYNLGTIYENGLGTTHDSTKALEWYRKAAESGHPTAQEKFVSLSIK